MTSRVFQNYLEVERQGPPALWWALRLVAFAFTLFVLVMIPLSGEHGLKLVWNVLVPCLPVVFAFAPGVWRQICPMAFLNQLPRTFGLSRGLRLPAGMSRVAYLVSVCAFFGLISLRPLVFNTSAGWTLTLLAVPLGLAALGGFVFAGRSGWCGTFCPLAPIQRAYGLAPVVRVRNGYCETCLGCQKNCYDFNPRATLLADFDDRDPWYVLQKRFFIGALPGFILGFFGYSVLGEVLGEALGLGNGVAVYYLVLAGGMTSSLGLFTVLETFLRVPQVHLSAIFAQIALVIFYGVLSQPFMDTLGLYIAPLQTMAWLDEVMVVVVALVAATVLIRHFIAHRAYHRDEEPAAAPKLKVALDRLGDDSAGLPQLEERASGNRLPANPSQTVLETLEDAGIKIDYGCRLGLCGADPVAVVEGEENLEEPSEDELATLRRLGLEGRARLACACRVKQGRVAIDLDLDPNSLPPPAPATAATDPAEAAGIGRVVIVGNGAAGTTVATELRRMSPSLDIDLIGAERYPFYNRMGVARLIHKAIGADELFLLDPKRHDDLGITLHRNTQATGLDPASQTLTLGTGETLSYDRLILSTGALAALPPVPGTDLRGVFVIRTAEDAEQIRAFAQSLPQTSRKAVVVGGGVLGVEAADALRQLSFRTTILQRSDRLMPRELDEPAALRLTHFLNLIGITVRTQARTTAIEGDDGQVTGVRIDPSEVVAADLVVFCAGVKPEITLAAQAGLDTDRGVLVNEAMQTSDPSIYAIGDAAQTDPALPALWPISTHQASVASAHLLGVAAPSAAGPIFVRLKHDGIAVFSFGQIDEGADEGIEEIVSNVEDEPNYRRLRLKGNRMLGAIVVGMPGAEKFLLPYLAGEPVPAAVLADWRSGVFN